MSSPVTLTAFTLLCKALRKPLHFAVCTTGTPTQKPCLPSRPLLPGLLSVSSNLKPRGTANKWNQTAPVLLQLASSSRRGVLEVRPGSARVRDFLPPRPRSRAWYVHNDGSVRPATINAPARGLAPNLGCGNRAARTRRGADISWDPNSSPLGDTPRNGAPESHGDSAFNSWRARPAVSTWLQHVTLPPAVRQASLCPTPSPAPAVLVS